MIKVSGKRDKEIDNIRQILSGRINFFAYIFAQICRANSKRPPGYEMKELLKYTENL